jgi:transporter family-2 protein
MPWRFSTPLLALLGVLGGASLVVQASLNAGLRGRLQSATWAGLASYVGGTIVMLIAVAIVRPPLRLIGIAETPLVWWVGGFFGAVYLVISIVLVPRLGTATLFGLVVTGQLVCALVCDHFGWLGVPVHHLDVRRVAGAAMLVAGTLLIRW